MYLINEPLDKYMGQKKYPNLVAVGWVPQALGLRPVDPLCFFYSLKFQLMVNCWFGLVVWESRSTPKVANPFHFRGS